MSFIPVNRPLLLDEDFELLSDAFRTGWISSAGKYIDIFENDWAQFCGRKYGVAVSNGTTALEIAVESLGIGPGDEVIMPSYTIISCAQAIVRAGAKPVFIDSEPETWCINPDLIEEKINPFTRAIMVVHIFGHPVDMDPILKIASKYKLQIIEDAAEVHGAQYLSNRGLENEKWIRCGSMGDVSTFSFFANKLITTGEGGMVLTDNFDIYEKLKSLRNLCFIPERRFLHKELGHQFRITNMQAAVGVNQIKRMDKIIQRKREIADQYNKRLSGLKNITLPGEKSWAKSVFWVYPILLGDSVDFDAFQLAEILKSRNIETRPFFLGMHEQPVLKELGLCDQGSYPICELISRRGLYLPSGLGNTDEEIGLVSDCVLEILE